MPVNTTTAVIASAGMISVSVTRTAPLVDCVTEEGGSWRLGATGPKATKVAAVFKRLFLYPLSQGITGQL